jgi:hypothetical protein
MVCVPPHLVGQIETTFLESAQSLGLGNAGPAEFAQSSAACLTAILSRIARQRFD